MKRMLVSKFLIGTALLFSLSMESCKSKPKDADIQTSFSEKARTDGRLANISATVNEGVVTLTGQCEDEGCKSYAEQSAKELKGVKSVVNNITVMAVTAAPVEIATDTALEAGLKDATKDYPNVVATTSNGEVTLTGSIERERLPRLMQAINALNPRKVNQNLTVK